MRGGRFHDRRKGIPNFYGLETMGDCDCSACCNASCDECSMARGIHRMSACDLMPAFLPSPYHSIQHTLKSSTYFVGGILCRSSVIEGTIESEGESEKEVRYAKKSGESRWPQH